MKILFFGDIFGKPGRQAIEQIIPKWRKKYQPDLIIANGENLAHGCGITQKSINQILKAGIDIVTSGDHIQDQKQALALLENKKIPLIRPANFLEEKLDQGYRLIEVGTKKVLVINLIGQVFISEKHSNPFKTADRILEETKEETNISIVDFHAEATSEKICLGWYLDGRVSAVLGTHTHIPTADARILPQGTGYITDVGMVGVRDSSLGADKDIAIKRFLGQNKLRLQPAQGKVEINAALLIIGKKGKTRKIKKLRETIDLN